MLMMHAPIGNEDRRVALPKNRAAMLQNGSNLEMGPKLQSCPCLAKIVGAALKMDKDNECGMAGR